MMFQLEIIDCLMLLWLYVMGVLVINWEIYVDIFELFLVWFGMSGDRFCGGFIFEEYMCWQNVYYEVECRVLEDLLLFELDLVQLLLVDMSGLFCEVLLIDDELFERLVERFMFVFLCEMDVLMVFLIFRFRNNLKFIFYFKELLVKFWNSYMSEKNLLEKVVFLVDFVYWVYERLVEKC